MADATQGESMINKTSALIDKALKSARLPLQTLPALPLICATLDRPGLSALALTAKIIQRLPEAGIDTGANPDGTDNMIVKFVRIISEEIVKEIKENMKVTTAAMSGTLNVQVGPSGTGTNITPFTMSGPAE